jgi:hypothetical protein
MIAAVISSATVVALAILGAGWALASRLARMETKVEELAAALAEIRERVFSGTRRGRQQT